MRWRELAFAATLVVAREVAAAPPSLPPIPPAPTVCPPVEGRGAGRVDHGSSKARAARPADPTGAGRSGARAAVTVTLEPPYKLGERALASDGAAMDPRETQRWNVGGLGALARPAPPPDGHPDPRVIVELRGLEGPHDAKEVLRLARRNFWIHAIRCYRLAAYRSPELKGWTDVTGSLSPAGDLVSTALAGTELSEPEVAECLVDKLRVLHLPRADATSSVRLAIRLGPGDEPMPPPEERIVPGPGQLSSEAMRRGVRAGLARFKDCYRSGLAYAPELWGRLSLRFHVTEAGAVDEVFEGGSAFPDARVRQCVLRAARRLSFPRPEGGDVRFVVPVRFSSARSTHAAHPPVAVEPPRPKPTPPKDRAQGGGRARGAKPAPPKKRRSR